MRLGAGGDRAAERGHSRRPAEARRSAAVGRPDRGRLRHQQADRPRGDPRSRRDGRDPDPAGQGRRACAASMPSRSAASSALRCAPARKGLAEAVEMRRLLEPPIARLAALRRTADDLARLDAILAAHGGRAAGRSGAGSRPISISTRPSPTMSGNRLLRLQMRGLRPILQEVMQLFNARRKRTAGRVARNLRAARRVVEAIRSGDGDAAFRAMEHHFEAAQDAIGRSFRCNRRAAQRPQQSKESKTREKRP